MSPCQTPCLQKRFVVADWNALVRAGVYTAAEVARMKKGGSYLGYRTAISRQGRWLFFVSGD